MSFNHDNEVLIDVSGQTCPGYLLNIDKKVRTLASGTMIRILTTYIPCENDLKAWCKFHNYKFIDLTKNQEKYQVRVKL